MSRGAKLLAAACLALGLCGFLLYRMFGASCGSDLLSEALSPGGVYVAFAFQRNCGATTPYTRLVALRRADAEPDFEDKSGWVLLAEGQPDVTLEWTAPDRVSVGLIGPYKVHLQQNRWKYGVVIHFR